jgi:4-hydroxy-3-methylbut-2-en-1-yl diphosphate reductase
MPSTAAHPGSALGAVVLAFDGNNRLAVRRVGAAWEPALLGASRDEAQAALSRAFGAHTRPAERFRIDAAPVLLAQVDGPSSDPGIEFLPIDTLASRPGELGPLLSRVLGPLDEHLIAVPYLNLGENDFIYKFRPEKERNMAIYGQDAAAQALYQSLLCMAIKALARTHERTAASPVELDFGAVRYLVPSHFGFCLGVKNAIERAYETLAENPGRRVFMLSELIHNPFVNEDLLRRGLRYLQTDKGVPHRESPGGPALWDTLQPEDIVIIPAFGATDEDKRRLVRRGVAVRQYDATCMLVEKVWKAARAYGREGYTVVIHGKYEHEETKATFSNTRRHAPAVIVRNLEETRILGEVIANRGPGRRELFERTFAGKATEGFDVDRHLERVAVVNQTTLLVNETREIIAHLRDVFAERYGPDPVGSMPRVGGQGRNDTLCYATQVNQDALSKALGSDVDAAFVIGGKNSSNTYQLYRLCEKRLGERAFFIQSESDILSDAEARHFVFPPPGGQGRMERRALRLPGDRPARILLTGGASCPDGIIQQVITRVNSLFPQDALRTADQVLGDLAGG